MFDTSYTGRGNLLNAMCRVNVMACLTLSAITLSACSQVVSVNEETREIIQNDKTETSLEEAIALAQDEADSYYENLQPVEIHSYDNDQDRSVRAGEDGKREWWYVNFANEKNNFVSVLVVDGEVESVECFDENWYGDNRLISMDDVVMTTQEAVQKAEEIGLMGGNPEDESHWISGYNFSLSYASLASSLNDYKMILEVIGISPNGNFACVYFDAETGEPLLAEEKIEYDNGDVEWKSFNSDITP